MFAKSEVRAIVLFVFNFSSIFFVLFLFAFNYDDPKRNNTKKIEEKLKTNKTIALTSDFANIKNQFDKKGNFTATSKFEDFTTDLTPCGKAVIKKYNLSMETGVAFHSISTPKFINIMKNGT
jgi:hypothetical protein